MAFWDTWFGGNPSDQLQEIQPNYQGMHDAAPSAYNRLQDQRAATPGAIQLPDPQPQATLQQKLGAASQLLPPDDSVAVPKQRQVGSADFGLLNYYNDSIANNIQPIQSRQGLLTMPTYNFAGAR